MMVAQRVINFTFIIPLFSVTQFIHRSHAQSTSNPQGAELRGRVDQWETRGGGVAECERQEKLLVELLKRTESVEMLQQQCQRQANQTNAGILDHSQEMQSFVQLLQREMSNQSLKLQRQLGQLQGQQEQSKERRQRIDEQHYEPTTRQFQQIEGRLQELSWLDQQRYDNATEQFEQLRASEQQRYEGFVTTLQQQQHQLQLQTSLEQERYKNTTKQFQQQTTLEQQRYDNTTRALQQQQTQLQQQQTQLQQQQTQLQQQLTQQQQQTTEQRRHENTTRQVEQKQLQLQQQLTQLASLNQQQYENSTRKMQRLPMQLEQQASVEQQRHANLSRHLVDVVQQLAENLQQQQQLALTNLTQQLSRILEQQLLQNRQHQQQQLLEGGCDELVTRWPYSGVYSFNISGVPRFSGYCDMTTPCGGWLVFQRRLDGSVDFNRSWADYKSGFGNLSGEFWLGNDLLHQLTSRGQYLLRVDLSGASGSRLYAEFTNFSVSSEVDKYRMTYGSRSDTSFYSGNDYFGFNNGAFFSTFDRDNDQDSRNYAQLHAGAWWYTQINGINLNGLYNSTTLATNIHWFGSTADDFSALKFVEMKLKRET